MILVAILALLSGISEGCMDLLNFRFHNSVFKNLNQNFWNKDVSYKNKYSNGNKFKQILLSTVFVMFTDGWHLFKALHTIFLFSMVIAVNFYTETTLSFAVTALVAYLFKKLVFELSYNLLQK